MCFGLVHADDLESEAYFVLVWFESGDVLTADQHLAGQVFLEVGDDAPHGGFAAAR